MENLQSTVQKYQHYVAKKDLKKLINLFSENIDWYVPGDEENVSWAGRRGNKKEVSDYYELLWQSTEPVSLNIENIFFNGDNVAIAGEYSIKMLHTNKIVDSLFVIQMTVENDEIVKYRFLEDSYAVSNALIQSKL